MVIQKFNKLIRNKWLWGAFAAVISAAFCFEGCFTAEDSDLSNTASAGKLGQEEVSLDEFQRLVDDIRGFGSNRDNSRSVPSVNLEAWELLAALDVAGKNGIKPANEEIVDIIRNERAFQKNGVFNFALYRNRLMELGFTPERFEDYLRRRVVLMRIGQSVAAGASWASPAELDQAVADMTDVITIKVANFTQDLAEAKKIKVDDKAVKQWYEKHIDELALPERMKIRFVRFNALDEKILGKMAVSEDEMHDYYDVRSDRYTTTDTNGVEKVKPFEEVKPEIEKELRKIAAINYFETNIGFRVYSKAAAKGSSRLDEIASEEGLKVSTSAFFTLTGEYKQGFMTQASFIIPSAENFKEIVSDLDSEVEDLRYGIVRSSDSVWLVEKGEVSPAHTPTFEEARAVAQRKALAEAKELSFKNSVAEIVKRGEKAVLATKNVSTNITFSVCDLTPGQFNNQSEIVKVASKLSKGEVSEFVKLTPHTGFVVVCLDRKEGDAAKAVMLRASIAGDLMSLQRVQIPQKWQKWNLSRIGYETSSETSVKEVQIEEE